LGRGKDERERERKRERETEIPKNTEKELFKKVTKCFTEGTDKMGLGRYLRVFQAATWIGVHFQVKRRD
jgi:hypothetical protein